MKEVDFMTSPHLSQRVLRILAAACDEEGILTQMDLDLYENNLLDSMALVQLLEGLEDEWGLELWPTQLSREDTRTPAAVVRLVEEKLVSQGKM